jgi:imidazole glycerol phosphate synthase subunit HisF
VELAKIYSAEGADELVFRYFCDRRKKKDLG